MATKNDYDAIVLDVILDARGPAIDGFEVRPAAPDRQPVGARAHGDRPGRRGGPGTRPGRWRGRLPDEAVFAGRTPGAAAGADAERATARPAVLSVGDLSLDSGPPRGGAERQRDRTHPDRVRAAGVPDAQSGRCPHQGHAGRARLGLRLRRRSQDRQRLHPLAPRQDRPSLPAGFAGDGKGPGLPDTG